jgi:hypothetical protein
MKLMKIASIALLTVPISSGIASADISDTWGKASEQSQNIGNGPSSSNTDQHYISKQGCTYSRAQAPGYAPTWHLVLNGSQYGMTDAKKSCPMMLRSR